MEPLISLEKAKEISKNKWLAMMVAVEEQIKECGTPCGFCVRWDTSCSECEIVDCYSIVMNAQNKLHSAVVAIDNVIKYIEDIGEVLDVKYECHCGCQFFAKENSNPICPNCNAVDSSHCIEW